MAISANQIVEVNARLLQASGTDLEFNGLLLSKNSNIPSNSVLSFADPTSVSEYFGSESDEANFAQIYFLGYTNSFKKPRAFYIAPRYDTARPAWLRGGEISIKISELQSITNGNLGVSFGENTVNLTGLNFSSISTWSDIAVILESAIRSSVKSNELEIPVIPESSDEEESLQVPENSDLENNEKVEDFEVENEDSFETYEINQVIKDSNFSDEIRELFEFATVEYSSLYKAFIIRTGGNGSLASIDYCTEIIADMLCLTAKTSALLSQGMDALSESQNMEKILTITQNWVNFTTAWMPSVEEVLNFGNWSSLQGVAYLYLYSDNDPALLQSNSENTIAYSIKEENLSSISGQYSSVDYSIFLMSVAACIDWNRTQGTISTAFKAQSGLSATVNSSTDAANLTVQGMNFVGDYATRNDTFTFHYPGQMFGDYKWIDSYWNAIWFNNVLQVSLLNGLAQSPRTPYNQQGYSLVRAWLQDPINRALKNGVIEAGIILSESQKAQINREAGKNIADEIYATGYYIQVEDPGSAARTQRESPVVNVWYSYGGSINRLVVASTALV